MNTKLLIVAIGSVALGALMLPAAESKQAESSPVAWAKLPVEKQKVNQTEIGLRTSRYGGTFAGGQPIPVSIEIRNFGPQSARYPTSHVPPQLYAHWEVNGKTDSNFIPFHSGDDLYVESGKTFEKLINLAELLPLREPGEYKVSLSLIGYAGFHGGDWLGDIQSPECAIRIVPEPEATR